MFILSCVLCHMYIWEYNRLIDIQWHIILLLKFTHVLIFLIFILDLNIDVLLYLKNCNIDLNDYFFAELVMKNILIHNSKIFFYHQGYLLYRDVNNHSMTAIRISPETLEQDGTVMLPGTLLTLSFVFFYSQFKRCAC